MKYAAGASQSLLRDFNLARPFLDVGYHYKLGVGLLFTSKSSVTHVSCWALIIAPLNDIKPAVILFCDAKLLPCFFQSSLLV